MSDDWGNDPIQKAAPAGDWGNDPVVGTKGYKFSDAAITSALKKPSTSTVWMKPDQYLSLTPDLPSNPRTDKKGASLKASLDKGDQVDEVPSLDVTVGKDGTGKVVDQDGRHRAQFAKDAGVDLIPVAVKRSGEKGQIKNLAGMKPEPKPEEIFERNKAYAKPGATEFKTKLNPKDEAEFQKYMADKSDKTDLGRTDDQSYDMRGWWKAHQAGDPRAATRVGEDGKVHRNDYWKTPYHPSFSAGSQWAGQGAPKWNDKDQLVAPDGKVVFDERAKPGVVPFDFNSVTPPQKAKPGAQGGPAAPKPLPRWDVLGDIGRAAEGAVAATGADLKAAFPDSKTRIAEEQANRGKYGFVGGQVANQADSVKRMGNALKAPLDALGVLASPITGAAHAIGGSAIAAGLDHMALPGHDTKADADAMIDQAMIGLGPEGMEGGAAGISAAAAKSAAAKTANAATQKTVNALRKVSDLKPGVREAHDAGYVLPPVMAKDAPNTLEKFGSADAGKIKIQQAASVKNQEVTNGIAAQELGLPKDTMLTEKVFKGVRAKANKAYSDIANSVPFMQADDEFKTVVSNLGGRAQKAAAQFKGVTENPELDKLEENLGKVDLFDPNTALFVVRKLRKDASGNLKNTLDPNKAGLGMAQRKAADAVDALVERNLVKEGKGDLVPKYKAARQMLAKSHDVEGATNTTTGDVSAIGLARLHNRGAPFTGGLKTIAESATSFRKAFQNPEAFGGVEPYSVLDLGAAGAAVASHRFDVLGGILARPLVRNALLSKGYQDRMIPDLANLPVAPSNGMTLLHNTPLPGVQNQLAKGIFRAAHVNGLRALTMPQAATQPPQGQ